MRNALHRAGYLLFVAGMAALGAPLATAADPGRAGSIEVEFRDIPRNPGVTYHLKWVIEVEGHEMQFKATTQTEASSGKALCENTHFAIKNAEERGWAVEKDGTTLSITGWTDPATGKFHPVKKVTFTSDDLPKDLMPKVTDTRKKA